MKCGNKILIIAYEFPPLNSGGVHRIVRFMSMLKNQGKEVVLITADPADYPRSEQFDPDSYKYDQSEVIRVPLSPPSRFSKFENSYFFHLTDNVGKRWKKNLFAKIDELLLSHTFDALLITAPPFSVAAMTIPLRERYKMPIILDLRDAWSTWNIVPFSSIFHYQLLKKLERKCIDSSDVCIVTSAQTRKDILNVQHGIFAEKLKVITNAFEGEVNKMQSIKDHGVLNIGYVGSFYYSPEIQRLVDASWWCKKPYQIFQYSPRREDWLYRSPYFIFRIFKELFNQHPELMERIKLRFAGKKPHWFDGMVRQFDIEDNIEHVGILSKEESIEFQQECDALLITSSKVVGGDDYSIAGKTFEYMTSGRPVLAFVTSGAQRELLTSTGIAVICDPDDTASAVIKLNDFFRGVLRVDPDYKEIDKYSSHSTGLNLLEILDKL